MDIKRTRAEIIELRDKIKWDILYEGIDTDTEEEYKEYVKLLNNVLSNELISISDIDCNVIYEWLYGRANGLVEEFNLTVKGDVK